MKSAGGQVVVLMVVVVVMLAAAGVGGAAEATTSEACRNVITNMQSCLPYVGPSKAAAPTTQCCGEVNSTVQHSAECLCEFIGLVRQGPQSIRSLGIQEAKLAQLPSVCGLKNVSSTNCTNLAPTSSPGASSSNSTSGNFAYKLHTAFPVEALVVLAMIAFLLPIPNGLGFDIFV